MRYRVILITCLFALAACKSDEERAADYFASAQELSAVGDVDRALVELRNVFDYDGYHKEARLLFADLLLSRGEIDGAYRQYLRLIEQYPDTVEVRRTLAELASFLGDWERMKLQAEAAISLAPDTPSSRALRASIDYHAAQIDRDDAAAAEAAGLALMALEEDPEQGTARRVLIDWQLQGPNPETALPLINAELERWPSDRLLRMAKIQILGQDGPTDKVGGELNTLYGYYPQDPDIYELLIRWYVSRDDLQGAKRFLSAEAGADDADPAGHMALISFMLQTDQATEAEAELERLIEVNGDSPAGRYYQAMAASMMYDAGQQQEGIRRARAALDGAGEGDLANQSRMTLIRMLASRGETAEAKSLVETILGSDPGFVEALKFRAAWALQEDRGQDALVDLRTALNADQRDSEALMLQAQAYMSLGNRELGLQSLALAVEASRNAPRESLTYARVLIAERRLSAAQSVLLSALNQTPADLDVAEVLGNVLLRGGDVDRADALAEHLSQIDDPRGRGIESRLRAGVLMARNQVDQSLALLRQTVADSDNTDLRAILQVLQTQLVAGRIEEARVYMQETRAQSPDEPFLKLLDADLHAIEGNNAMAIDLYQQLLVELPTSPIIVEKTYRLLRREGRADEATEVIEAGLPRRS